MKKKRTKYHPDLNRLVRKGLLIMKLSLFLMVFGVLQSAASVYSQTWRFSMNEKVISVKEVLTRIENNSEFRFFYEEKKLDVQNKLVVDINNATIEEVLSQLFDKEGIEYKVLDNNFIILKPKGDGSRLPLETFQQQQKSVTGKVTDSSGAPLPGVTALIKGTTNGTITDSDGNYSLSNIPENATLQFSFVGMKGQEIEVGGKTTINVTLAEEVIGVDEVVVVGYGTQKKVNVTGSISTVNMTKLENAPVTNATQALQGVQGVYVNQAGGQPGRDAATIRIRGLGTLNNNSALVLVNGIEYPLSDVNPNDIENISVLKDAASTAIYGNRASNGVILVTTKSGVKGKIQVNYNNYFGLQIVNYLPDFVTDPILFMQLRNQAMVNEGRKILDYSESLIEEYKQGMKTDPYTYPGNDWPNIMYDPAPIQNQNLQFSGGNENVTYLVNLGYLDQKGVLMGTNSKKYSLRFNTIMQASKKLKIGSSIDGNYRIINEPGADISELTQQLQKATPYHPTYLQDGRYANSFIYTSGMPAYRNPLALANEGKNNSKEQHYLVNLFAEYKLPFSINYKINAAITKSDDFTKNFTPLIYSYNNKTGASKIVPFYGGNRSNKDISNLALNTTFFNTLDWAHSFKKLHNISALLGLSMESFSNRYFWAKNEGYLTNDLHELNAGSQNPIVAGSSTSSKLNSYFGRLGYNYNEKYLFETNFRYDGSSRFAKDKRWGFFPSFSAGWRLDKENFLKNVSWISNLKLRASWGQLGNQNINLFRYVDLINLGQEYVFGNNVSPGAAVTAYNDPNISWETTTISNLGLDLGIFKNKLNFVLDVFKKHTTDILRGVNLPDQVGSLAGPIRNIGSVDNNGFELGLDYRNSLKDFTYQFSGSLTKIMNKVVNLNGETIFSNINIIKEGYPINSYYLPHAIGIFQSQEEVDKSPFQTNNTKPGYLKYQDTDGDGKITSSDRIITGRSIPKYTYQFSLNIGYKGLEVNCFFQGVQNINTYLEMVGAQPFWNGGGIQKEWITDSWTPQSTSARLPILTTYEGSVNENFRWSDFWLRDASYLRLKNLQISYSFPKRITDKLGIINLKLFVNGQNLFTFSKMKDYDPEKTINNLTSYEYPTVKIYSSGINVTF
jgi:TonB-linked SusC/RagA family outer membrane protein